MKTYNISYLFLPWSVIAAFNPIYRIPKHTQFLIYIFLLQPQNANNLFKVDKFIGSVAVLFAPGKTIRSDVTYRDVANGLTHGMNIDAVHHFCAPTTEILREK